MSPETTPTLLIHPVPIMVSSNCLRCGFPISMKGFLSGEILLSIVDSLTNSIKETDGLSGNVNHEYVTRLHPDTQKQLDHIEEMLEILTDD